MHGHVALQKVWLRAALSREKFTIEAAVLMLQTEHIRISAAFSYFEEDMNLLLCQQSELVHWRWDFCSGA